MPNPGAVPAAAPVGVVPLSGLSIGSGSTRYALAPNQSIDFSALFGAAGVPPGCLGLISPEGDGMAIRNTGSASWTVTTPDGATTSVQPGASVRAAPATKLLFGQAAIDIQAF